MPRDEAAWRRLGQTLEIMKAILFPLAASLLVCACAVRMHQYYLPTDSTLAKEGSVCGSIPFGSARIPLGETLHATISATPSENNIALSIQLPLPLGAKVRFLKPELAIESSGIGRISSGRLAPFRISVYGGSGQPSHHEYLDSSTLLEGKGRNLRLATAETQYLKSDLFVSGTVIAIAPPESVVLVFPAVEVNGTVIKEQRIPLRLVRKTGVLACVQ